MTDKDYLQIAKDDLNCSYGLQREYEGAILDAAQAQAAASIAIAERLGDLILAVALLAEGLQKHNEREEMVLAKTRNFVVSP